MVNETITRGVDGTYTVMIPLELSKDFLSDILITAFDGDYGGCWYWAEPHEKDGNPFDIENRDTQAFGLWRSVAIIEKEASGDKRKWCMVDHARLVKGIAKLFEPGVLPKRQDVRNAIIQLDSGAIDVEGADIIVQLGMFGELVYG